MPRFFKKRSKGLSLTGTSHHKVCGILVIDDNNNIFLKIAELGKYNKKMLDNCLKIQIKNVDSFSTDSASVYESFCLENLISLHQVPSGQHS